MATGWAEFLKRLQRLTTDEQRGPEAAAAAWTRFQKLAVRSEHAKILKPVVRLGRALPESQRYVLAVSISRLLAPVEWPSEWALARPELVTALDMLLEETDPTKDASLFSFQGSELEAEREQVGYLVFYSARSLLRVPCRRDELRTVAILCNTGLALCLRSYRLTAQRIDAGTAPSHIAAARVRCRSALIAYMEAAGKLNDAVGSVLFEGMHAPLEEKP